MRILLFARRNTKEILRDPINLLFALGFPLILLFLFSVINSAIPAEAKNDMFIITKTAPGMATFGTVFFALFSGVLLAKDRTSSFLMRLFAAPMTSMDYIIGYTLPILAMAAIQSIITFSAAVLLGLHLSVYMPGAVLIMLPIAVLYVGVGLLCGSLLNEKAVSGICGALLTNIAGWFSGIWIPLDLIGGGFKKAAEVLPFYHGVEATKQALAGDFAGTIPHLAVVLGYVVVFYGLAIIIFRRKMRGDKA